MTQFASRSRALWSVLISGLIWLLLIGAVTVGAQATATPITIGQNITGNISDASSAALYSIQVGAPQSVTLLVLAVTPGFAPTFRVLDPSGLVVLDTANPGTLTIAEGTPNLASSGTYTIEVKSANNTAGQFLISVQAGAPLSPPTALTPGTPVSGSVDAQTTRQAYSFSGSVTDVLLLTVRSEDSSAGAVVALRDADTDETLGLNSTALIGVSYRFPATARNYLLEITSSGASTAAAFTVCLATESGSATCPGGTTGTTVVAASATPTLIAATPALTPTFAPVAINPTGACQVASARGATINVRSGPGTNYSVITKLAPTLAVMVIGRTADNSWFEINVADIVGWVSATVVIAGGNCSGVTIVVLPTAVPPTNPPSNPPPSAPTAAPPSAPTTAPTTLNSHARPLNGEVNLSEGFSPDPYSAQLTGSGEIAASYLGGACTGYTNTAPNFRLHYSGASGEGLVRFFFLSDNGDNVSMVVGEPAGGYYCNDDSFDTNNPTLDFYTADNGTYNVWIASDASGSSISGTLVITATTILHPMP